MAYQFNIQNSNLTGTHVIAVIGGSLQMAIPPGSLTDDYRFVVTKEGKIRPLAVGHRDKALTVGTLEDPVGVGLEGESSAKDNRQKWLFRRVTSPDGQVITQVRRADDQTQVLASSLRVEQLISPPSDSQVWKFVPDGTIVTGPTEGTIYDHVADSCDGTWHNPSCQATSPLNSCGLGANQSMESCDHTA